MKLETLQKEMITAMKNKEKLRKDTISGLIGAVKKTAIDKKCKDNITESLVDEVLLKEQKSMQEMIDTCPADREETLNEYKAKMEVIKEFAPKLMNEEEVREVVFNILSTTDVQKTNKGAIMKVVMPELKGKADGKLINQIVTEIVNKAKEEA